ncbi:MAG: SpaA isopeptide-forming pilin-related protein [Lachnospiraceae bacterium]|nr:SpaA isopeptide-forming pilin-related protein [Lachnospiraceae bacterium]
MDSSLLERAKAFLRAQRKKSIWYRTMCGLAAVVVFVTTYMLILPAITMERDTICGKTEHKHTDECYETITIDPPKVLNCTKDTLEVHKHTDACYDSDHNLICGYADFVIHTHDKNCYDEDGKLVCTLPEIKEHRHTASCYQEEKKLICTKEESEGHKHTADCYKKEKDSLQCTKEEHTHNEECYDENGNLVCTKEEHTHDDSCYTWKDVLICKEQESEGHKHTDACYETVKTLICDKQEAYPHTHTDACYKDGKLVCGQLETKEHQHTADCWKADGEAVTEKKLICEIEEHEHSEECYKKETEDEGEDGANAVMLLDDDGGNDGESVDAAAPNTLPVTKLSGDETKYDSETDTFKTKVRIDFQFTSETGKPAAGTVYTYTYPEGIVIPDAVVNKGAQNLYDGDKLAGTYQFIKNADGTYSVQVIFNENYVNESGDTVTGYVQFEGSFSKEDMNEKGDIVVGGDDVVVLVPGEDITYPKDETESYDIDVSKSGSWVQDGDKLVYTVYVRTTKGTPDPINFTDILTVPEGLTVDEPTVEVKKYVRHIYGEYSQSDATEGSIVSASNYTYYDGTISMTLPGLSILTDQTHGNYDTSHSDYEFYIITYTYPITDQTVESVSPKNNVTVTAKDDKKGQTVTDSDKSTVNVNKDFSYTLDKSGAVASDKPGYIKWTITVNSNEVDIAGTMLTDEMLGLVEDSDKDIVIYPAEGASVIKGEDDKITKIGFLATENGANKNKYTITYYTPVEESWDGTTVTNKATLNSKPDETGDEKEATASVTVKGVQLNKQGTYNGTTNQIDWTITVNSGNLDIAGATLTDEMFAALSETDFTIEPSTGYSFTKDADGKITGITFTAGEDGKNTQSYTIKYSTDVTENEDDTISPVKNQATLSPKDGTDGTPISSESTVAPEEVQLSKSGNYDWNGKINWTITVNGSGRNIAGAVLTDEMFAQLTSADITIKKKDGCNEIAADLDEYTIETDKNGNIASITFNAIGDTGVNTNQYTITYSTDALREWNDKTVHNKSKLTLDGKEIPGTADVTIPGDGSVAKSAGKATVSEDGNTLTIPWTVTLTIPKGGLPAGTTIIDDVTKKDQWNENKNQWMTRSQITAWATNFQWTDDSGNVVGGTNAYNPPPEQVTFLASNGNTYTYRQISEYEDPAGEENVNFEALTYTLFTIHFPEGLVPPEGATKLTFTYSTTLDLTKAVAGGNKVYNDIKVGGKETNAEYTYYKPGIVKTDGNGSTDTTTVSNEGTLTWKIKATVGEGNEKLTLIDTLPAGVTLESLQLSGWGNLNMELAVADDVISGTDSTNQYRVSGTYKDNIITLNVEPQMEGNTIQTGSEFTLTVNCKVNDAENQTESKTLTNTAKMELDGGEIGSSSQTQEWTYEKEEIVTKIVDKSGDWDNSNRIMNYTIVLNPEGKNLVEGSDTLTLIDTMTYTNQVWLQWPFDSSIAYSINAALIQSSVKLYKAVWDEEQGEWVAGEAVSGWSWTYEAKTSENSWETNKAINTITAVGIPDSTPLMFQYSYRITCNVPDEIDGQKTSFNISLSNTAKLEGTNYSGDHSSSDTKWEHSSDSAGVTTDKSYTFYKVEAGNYNVSLAGATFSVYKYDTSTGKYGEEAVKTYSTNSSGSFHITRQEKDSSGNVTFTYDTNTLYKVVETSPPDGYKLPDSVETYYFYFSSAEDETYTLPEKIPSGAVDLSNEARTVYVENVKNTTEVTVEKKWQDKDENPIEHNNGSVTINLYQKTSQESSSGGGTGGDGIPVNVTVGIKNENDSYVYVQDDQGTLGSTQTSISVSSGTTITIKLYCSWADQSWATKWQTSSATANGTVLSRTEEDGGKTYIFTYQVCEDTTIDVWKNWGDEATATVTIDKTTAEGTTDSDESDQDDNISKPEGTLVETISLNSGSDWKYTFTNLPLTGTDESGNPVTYYYYIEEVSVPNYDISYDNNGGIQSGTITVTNKATDNPSYTLPETGGPGTRIAYTLGSVLMIFASAAFLYIKKKRMGKKGGLK